MFKDYKLKDIFYMMLGSIIITSVIGGLTIGGWGDSKSSQPPKPISKQDKRTVTEGVLKLIDEDEIKRFDVIEKQQEQKKIEQLTKKKPRWITFEATNYLATCKGCTGLTYYKGYNVTQTIRYKGYRIIAVDPKIIPLGSIVKVDTGIKTFKAVAFDIGSAIKGKSIDILVNDYNQAMRFGRRDVRVAVLEEGAF